MNQSYLVSTARILAARLAEYSAGIRATRWALPLTDEWNEILDHLSAQLSGLSISAESAANTIEDEIGAEDPEDILP